MNNQEFAEALVRYSRRNAISSTLKALAQPSGRRPDLQKVQLGRWWNGLTDADTQHVEQVITAAVDMTLFSVCTMLDGVSFIEETREKGIFELYYVRGDQRVRLNPDNGEELHNLYNWYSRDQFRQRT